MTCLILLSFQGLSANNEVLVAPIGRQQVVEGGGIRIFFNAFDPIVGAAQFSSMDIPSFATIIDNEDNTGFIDINTQLGDNGIYLFHLNVSGTAGNSTVPVYLNVIDISTLGGRVFYCDPVNGSMDNVGDSDNPWSTLEAVFTANTTLDDGDVLFLRDGYHGRPQILGQNDAPIYINAQANHQPMARSLRVVFANNWVISGLDISPEAANMAELGDYVKLVANAHNIVIENCHIYAIKDSSPWTTNQDWYDNCGNGVLNKGTNTTLRNNLFSNTYFSVTIDGEHNHFDFNIVDRYGGDAIRGLESNNSYNHNVITNAVVADYDTGNHDDAFQSWTFTNPVRNVEIIGNIVISCTDPDLPLKTNILQGIVMFDGFAENWVVENNLVLIDHPHGIALYGVKNSKVVNNTVIANPFMLFFNGSAPWIRLNKHKDGRASTGNLVRNNISGAMVLDDTPGTNDHNIVSSNYSPNLNDWDNWDFHLKASANAINAGFEDDAALTDNEGFTRLPSDTPDIGCFEYNATIYDVTAPSVATNLQVAESTNTSLQLTWTAASDETALAYYNINYNGKNIRTNDTEAWLCDLEANTNYDIAVTTVDHSGNQSPKLELSASTADILSDTYSIKISAHWHDQQIRSTNRLEWVRQYELIVGSRSPSFSTVGVIPFQLPQLSALEEIKFASLNTHLIGRNNSPTASVSVFGLTADSQSDVEKNFYWQGDFADNTTDTPIAQDYISPMTPNGLVTMNTVSMQALADYINLQYEQGAQAGDYIFLRLNSNSSTSEGNGNYYQLGSADAPASKDRPVLIVDIGLLPDAVRSPLKEIDGLSAYPNPIANGQEIYLDIPAALLQNECTVMIHDIQGQLIYQYKLADHLSNNASIQLNDLNITSGIYPLTVIGTDAITRTKIIIH